MRPEILSVDEFADRIRWLVNSEQSRTELIDAYITLHERCRDQERALEECAAQFEPSGSGLLGDIMLMKSELAALRERLDAPALDALLTRAMYYGDKYRLFFGDRKDLIRKEYTTHYDDEPEHDVVMWEGCNHQVLIVDESAIPAARHLPPGGGPVEVRLVMLPAKEGLPRRASQR